MKLICWIGLVFLFFVGFRRAISNGNKAKFVFYPTFKNSVAVKLFTVLKSYVCFPKRVKVPVLVK